MKFDLHCHTRHGSLDGKVSIEQYIRLLRSHGFDGMLITDHNSYRGYRAYKKLKEKTNEFDDFIVLKGIEYDTMDAGHFIVVMPDKVKLPILEIRGMPLMLLLKIVHGFGGILGPAHPYGAKFLSTMHSKRLKKHPELIQDFDFLEVHNTCNPHEANAEAQDLAETYHKPGIAGSDAHKTRYIGTAYTDIDYDIHNCNDFINAIRLRKAISWGGIAREYKEPGTLTRLLPISLAWKIYNRGLGMLKSHTRRINLKKLSAVWESIVHDSAHTASNHNNRKHAL